MRGERFNSAKSERGTAGRYWAPWSPALPHDATPELVWITGRQATARVVRAHSNAGLRRCHLGQDWAPRVREMLTTQILTQAQTVPLPRRATAGSSEDVAA